VASLDALSAAIRSTLDRARDLAASITASREQAAAVRDRLVALGIERGSAQIDTSVQQIEEGQAQAGAIAERLASALAAVDAARVGAGGASGGSGPSPGTRTGPTAPAKAPDYPHDRPHEISWSDLIHVCHGDENNDLKGGHLAGTGRPGKTEFPTEWDDERVRAALTAVAAAPEKIKRLRHNKFAATGVHRGVEVTVVVRSNGSIEAGWPVGGPGVRKNPD
jgi:hypothetical protein